MERQDLQASHRAYPEPTPDTCWNACISFFSRLPHTFEQPALDSLCSQNDGRIFRSHFSRKLCLLGLFPLSVSLRCLVHYSRSVSQKSDVATLSKLVSRLPVSVTTVSYRMASVRSIRPLQLPHTPQLPFLPRSLETMDRHRRTPLALVIGPRPLPSPQHLVERAQSAECIPMPRRSIASVLQWHC